MQKSAAGFFFLKKNVFPQKEVTLQKNATSK